MNIQSLSICVPGKSCINNCKFCVTHMHNDIYPNNITDNISMRDIYINDYIKRMEYARDNGCNTVMLTGQVEPQQNRQFLEKFAMMNKSLSNPFKNIEIQTTGAGIDEEYLLFMRNFVGITTISLSISCLDNNSINNKVISTTKKNFINLNKLCKLIKKFDFNLRLSLNITDYIITNRRTGEDKPENLISYIFDFCEKLDADQITFRKMYMNNTNTDQSKWILNYRIDDEDAFWETLYNHIKIYGKYLDTLEYGNKRYSYNGMSIVIDDDCMAKDNDKDSYKYLILRPNCKLYSKWDDKGSLIF